MLDIVTEKQVSHGKLNSNLNLTSGTINNDICECTYTIVGRIIFFDIGQGKTILKYNQKQRIGAVPNRLRPIHDLDFEVMGNGRNYIVSFVDGAMYIKPISDNLPESTPPYMYINICYLLK